MLLPATGRATDPADSFDFPVGWPNAEPRGDAGSHTNPDRWWQAQLLERDPESGSCTDDGHLGEDWNFGGGPSDLDKPVHSIANGEVIYAGTAQGWVGGIIMVRHTAPPGVEFSLPFDYGTASTVVSLYGHLDEDRIQEWVRVGDAVNRGDQIGVIGPYPGGSPHLHWEIRNDPDYGIGCGYVCNDGNCPPEDIEAFTWPSDFVRMNRVVRLSHRDAVDLAFGTADGGFRMATGAPSMQTRNVVTDVDPLTVTSGVLPFAGGPVKAVSAGNFVFAWLPNGILYWTSISEITISGGWQAVTPQPPTSVEQLLYAGGYLYALGTSVNSAYATLVRHDGSVGSWFSAGVLPLARQGYRVCASRGYIFYTGGTGAGNSDRVFSAPLHANGTIGLWTELLPMPQVKYEHGCAVSGDNLFVVGGANPTTLAYSATIADDGTIGPWRSIAEHLLHAPTAQGIWRFPLLAVGDRLITVGGEFWDYWNGFVRSTSGIAMCSVLPDGTTSSWQWVSNIDNATAGNAAVIIGDDIVTFGGWSNGYVVDQYDETWAGVLQEGSGAVSSARFAHDFSLPATAEGMALTWEGTSGPSSAIEIRYRVADPANGLYSVWSPWYATGPVPIVGSTNRIGYEIRAIVAPGENFELKGIDLGYRNTQPGATPPGQNLPVNLGTGAVCVYDEVTAGGTTTQQPLGEPPALPPEYTLRTAFQLTTSAVFNGLVQVILDTRGLGAPGYPLNLLHYESGAWRAVTSFYDAARQLLTAWVPSFSPFAVVQQASPTAVDALDPGVPRPSPSFHPNPFNNNTEVTFALSAPGRVVVSVYDSSGRLVRRLCDGGFPAGAQAVAWDGQDNNGANLPSGVYFLRLDAEGRTETLKGVLAR